MRLSWISAVIKVAITSALIAWLLHSVDLSTLFERFGRAEPWSAALGTVLLLALIALTGARWRIVLQGMGATLTLPVALQLTLIGHFFSQALPSSVGGDGVRAWLATREGIPAFRAVAGIFADRLAALVILILMVGATLPLFYARVPDEGARSAVAALVGGTCVGLAVLILGSSRLVRAMRRHAKLHALAEFAATFRETLSNKAVIGAIVAISLVVHLGLALSVWLVARSLSIAMTVFDCISLVPPIVLLTSVPISIAGWGVREAATVVAFGYIGVEPDDALALSIAFGAMQIAAGLPGGILWLARRRPRTPAAMANHGSATDAPSRS
jgi:uncharacterized protein (TIRG00374 family)